MRGGEHRTGQPRGHDRVSVTAGLADHGNGDLEPRTGDELVGQSPSDPGVGTARVPYGRDAEVQQRPEVAGREEELVGERALHGLERADAVEHGVYMTVEEAGQHARAGDVHGDVPVQPATDIEDPVPVDDDVGSGEPAAVEDPTAEKHRSRHGRHSVMP